MINISEADLAILHADSALIDAKLFYTSNLVPIKTSETEQSDDINISLEKV